MEKSVFFNRVTLGISTAPRQASCSGVVGQYIMDSTVFYVLLFGYSSVGIFVVCFSFEVFFFRGLLLYWVVIVMGFCFFVKELQVGCVADLEVLGGGEECNQIFINFKK